MYLSWINIGTIWKLNTIAMHAACITVKLKFDFYYESIDRNPTGSDVYIRTRVIAHSEIFGSIIIFIA